MNYLAHIYLARHSEPAMLGALLGDFARGDVSGRFGPEIELEILLHRRVDSYTDRHPVFVQARQHFDPARRRFAGILLDVFFDHALSRQWQRYSSEPLPDFIARFYGALDYHRAILPADLAELAPRMTRQDWLGSYGELEGVEMAISRMSHRLSRNGELLRDGLLDLRAHYAELCASFDLFFPELVAFSLSERERLAAG